MSDPHRQAIRLILAYVRRHFESYSNSARGAFESGDRRSHSNWCEKAHDWGEVMATVGGFLKLADLAAECGHPLNFAELTGDDTGDALLALEAECARLRAMLEAKLS